MDQAEKDGGGGGANALLTKFDKMLDLMGDRSIDEMVNGEFAESADDAYWKAKLAGDLHDGDCTTVPGGYKIKKASTQREIPDQYWYVLTRQAPEWSTNRARYGSELSTLRKAIGDLESWQHIGPIAQMDEVYKGLYTRSGFNETEFGNLRAHHQEIMSDLSSAETVWGNFGTMSRHATSWKGYFVQALRDCYLDNLPSILSGQTAAAGYLKGSLDVSMKVVSRGEVVVGDILDGTVKALEEAAAGNIDVSFSELLQVVSTGSEWAGKLAALIPGAKKYTKAVQEGVEQVASLTGMAKQLTDKLSSKAATSAGDEVKISGDTVDELIDSLQAEVKKCLDQIAQVENDCADMLSDFSDLMDKNHVVNRSVNGVTNLTSRDVNFRPKPVNGTGGAPRAEDKYDPPGLKDSGTQDIEIGGGEGINNLALMGAKTFPELAAAYRGVNQKLAAVDEGELSQALIRTTTGTKSRLHTEWVEVSDKLSKLFTESATNLDDVGDIVVKAALDIEGTDHTNGARINKATRDLIDETR